MDKGAAIVEAVKAGRGTPTAEVFVERFLESLKGNGYRVSSTSKEKPQPWSDNWQAQRVLAMLQEGPKTTIDLQDGTYIVHVARQIWELRHWYGHVIRSRKMGNNVARYTLVS